MIKRNRSLRSDLNLLACLLLIAVMAVGMMLSGQVLLNAAMLGVTLLLILTTYFFGIVIGLSGNLLFIFGQGLYMLYLYMTHQPVPFVLAFWLVLAPCLCLAVYGVTERLRQVQAENASLQKSLIEHGAFDRTTHLRTTVSFLEDAAVYTETSERFKIPVATVTIKIRYFTDLRQMLGDERVAELVQLTSDAIKAATRNNDITYILNRTDPTWAVLLFTDEAGANIAANRIRTTFAQQLQQTPSLAQVDLQLKSGVVAWDRAKMKDVNGFMAAGLKELEYDV